MSEPTFELHVKAQPRKVGDVVKFISGGVVDEGKILSIRPSTVILEALDGKTFLAEDISWQKRVEVDHDECWV